MGSWQVGDGVNLETSLRLGDELGGHLVFGHVDGIGQITALEPAGESWRLEIELPRSASAAGRRQGLDQRRRHLAHRERGERDHDRLDDHSAHLAGHHLAAPGGGRSGQSRGRHAGPLCRPPARLQQRGRLMDEASLRPELPLADRGRDRGCARRPHVHPGRRRGPRERGRPRHPGPVLRRRRRQLHGQARPRPDLPGAHPRALRGAGPAAHGAGQRAAHLDRVHRQHRGPGRRHHRHLGGRPGADHRGRHRSGQPPRGPGGTRPHLPAHGPRRRRAGAHRAHRGGGRPVAARRARSVGRDLRDHERRRHHGAPARPRRLRPAARAQGRPRSPI